MLIQLNLNCTLGAKDQIVNVSVYKATELIKAELASEYIPLMERKVVKPLTKVVYPEGTKKRGRPPKVNDEQSQFD